MRAKLRARLYVQACVRAAGMRGAFAAVVRRGDDDRGTVLLKLRRGNGCTVLAETRTPAGDLVWMRGTGPTPVAEDAAEAYIGRAVNRDPDLWVVEIEGGEDGHPLGEPVI